MKHVPVTGDIQDMGGFYMDLIKAGFEVHGISQQGNSTVISLDDLEDKDPAPIAELWNGRPAEPVSRKELLERRQIQEDFEKGRPERIRTIRELRNPRPADEGFIQEFNNEQILMLEKPPEKDSWVKGVKKVLAKLW